MLNEILNQREIEYLRKFISLPVDNQELSDNEFEDIINQAQDITTEHVLDNKADANYLNDITDKISEW